MLATYQLHWQCGIRIQTALDQMYLLQAVLLNSCISRIKILQILRVFSLCLILPKEFLLPSPRALCRYNDPHPQSLLLTVRVSNCRLERFHDILKYLSCLMTCFFSFRTGSENLDASHSRQLLFKKPKRLKATFSPLGLSKVLSRNNCRGNIKNPSVYTLVRLFLATFAAATETVISLVSILKLQKSIKVLNMKAEMCQPQPCTLLIPTGWDSGSCASSGCG